MKYEMLTFVILFVLIPSVISLECYFCNSNDDENCASDNIPDGYKHHCNVTSEPYCRKIAQTIDNIKSVVRTCGTKSGSKSCYKTAGKNTASVCSCNTNYCNNAISFNQQQQKVMTMISSIIILAITMIFLR
ncbi:unnamed protein product [Rotaria sp. Silwood2]|nr:unnamed protein product [Rotaria sp. Silwood2]CAF2554546.1 unnamed protein product [Rotaria sp. Silwood2]CAF2805076.1 unnamed protein product [Rotaria sp. Silwood2]CAF2961816.1 unnamed protein product [Rotaria sp. Silwood2]CAF3868098.1 unnamed protein product [Rotaria sp. Silwood2]